MGEIIGYYGFGRRFLLGKRGARQISDAMLMALAITHLYGGVVFTEIGAISCISRTDPYRHPN